MAAVNGMTMVLVGDDRITDSIQRVYEVIDACGVTTAELGRRLGIAFAVPSRCDENDEWWTRAQREDLMRQGWKAQLEAHQFHRPKWGHNKPRFRV